MNCDTERTLVDILLGCRRYTRDYVRVKRALMEHRRKCRFCREAKR